jgi:predicted NBD/HSP70 family sugar kinase
MRISDQEFNRLKLLKALRRAEPVSRTELVQLTGLAGGTITELTAELVGRNLILEEKTAAIGRGRPRTQLRLNPDAAFVAAANLSFDGTLTTEIVNLRGELLYAGTCKVAGAETVNALAEQYADAINDMITASPLRKSDIHRVGVALPAIIDSSGGILHWLSTYPAEPVPVASIMQQRLQLPVAIDSSADVVARAEHWFGAAELENFSLFQTGMNVGMARYVDGTLQSGANGINSEFGHVKAVIDGGMPCICGAHGCIAAHCSTYGIVSQICERRDREMPSLPALAGTFTEFARDACAGDQTARAIIDRAGQLFGIAVANHINECDPGRILVRSFDPVMPEVIATSFDAALRANTLQVLMDRTTIEWRVVDEDCYRKGAAALVLEQLYRLPGQVIEPARTAITA